MIIKLFLRFDVIEDLRKKSFEKSLFLYIIKTHSFITHTKNDGRCFNGSLQLA